MALHEASIPAGHKAGPMFWRDLWLAGSTLDTVRWWRHGAHELKTSVEQVHLLEPPSAGKADADLVDACEAGIKHASDDQGVMCLHAGIL